MVAVLKAIGSVPRAVAANELAAMTSLAYNIGVEAFRNSTLLRLYRAGDAARGVPACMACHGPSGAGNPGPAYPAVNGQDHAYVARRLEEYRTGTTTAKDAAHFKLMASVAKSLTDEEIQSLGSYVQGLHARSAGASKPASAH